MTFNQLSDKINHALQSELDGLEEEARKAYTGTHRTIDQSHYELLLGMIEDRRSKSVKKRVAIQS